MKSLQINYLAVFVSAVVTFVLGAIWYIGFSEPWMKLAGLTEEQIVASGGGASAYIISFITYLIGAYAMAILFKSMNISTLKTGAMTGALIGAALIGGNIFTNNAYELKPTGLSILNAGFSAISCAVMGAILGAWKKYQ
jgi:hypothetical protein